LYLIPKAQIALAWLLVQMPANGAIPGGGRGTPKARNGRSIAKPVETQRERV